MVEGDADVVVELRDFDVAILPCYVAMFSNFSNSLSNGVTFVFVSGASEAVDPNGGGNAVANELYVFAVDVRAGFAGVRHSGERFDDELHDFG